MSCFFFDSWGINDTNLACIHVFWVMTYIRLIRMLNTVITDCLVTSACKTLMVVGPYRQLDTAGLSVPARVVKFVVSHLESLTGQTQ